MKNLKIVCNIVIALCATSIANAQTNIGIKATGQPARIKSVSEVIAAEAYLPEAHTRKGKEKEEKAPIARLINPSAPLVSHYGSNPASNRTSSGVNMSLHSNFLATYIAEGPGFVPPDCNGDISIASQVMIVVNGRVKAFNVPGVNAAAMTTTQNSSSSPHASPILNLDLDAFFLNSGLGILKVCDPHVRFDRLSNRWFIIAQDMSHTTNNYLCIAMSNSSVLTSSSTFSFYYLLTTTGSPTPTLDFFDYPSFGIDKFGLYIGGNIYDNGMVTNKGSAIYVVNKDSILNGKLVFHVWQRGTGPGTTGSNGSVGMLTPQAVHNDDPNATEGYFIATDWVSYSKLVLKRISWNAGIPSLSADIAITVPTTNIPVNQPALGTSGTIDAFDDRLFAAMIMKNKNTGVSSLWTAHNIEVNRFGVSVAGGGRNGSRWYEIKDLTTTPVLQQSGTLYDSAITKPKGFWIPSIAMNGQGHAVLGSSTAALDRRVQVAIASRYATDPAGMLQSYDTVTKISSAYSPASGSTPFRWGDYSQTVIDPKDNMTFWTFQEYTTNNNQWGLRAIQVKAPAPAQTLTATAPGGNFCGADVTVTLTGIGNANEGFFDPGTGYNRLNVTCSGGISVSNINIVSPQQITCSINTAGKTAGPYVLTVINPDSQFVSTTFNLSSCSVLPLTLEKFTATAEDRKVELQWRSLNEDGISTYEVQKASNGISYSTIATVSAKNNFSNSYNITDNFPLIGNNYYRLKIIDRTGNVSFSEIRVVRFIDKQINISNVYPNPTSGLVNFKITSTTKRQLVAEVYDYSGKKIMSKMITSEPGMNDVQLDLGDISSGIYHLEINDKENNTLYEENVLKQ